MSEESEDLMDVINGDPDEKNTKKRVTRKKETAPATDTEVAAESPESPHEESMEESLHAEAVRTTAAHSGTSLLSGLLPIGNAGNGIISLSRPSAAAASAPVQLPPPKAAVEKKHISGSSANSSSNSSNGNAPNGNSGNRQNSKGGSGNGGNSQKGGSSGNNRRGGGTNGGSKFVRDDVAFVEEAMDAADLEAIYEPAYVDDVKQDITRPRLDRYELMNTAPEILLKIGDEQGGFKAGNMSLAEYVDGIIERNNAADGVNDLTFGAGVVVRTKESGDFGVLRSAEVNYVGTTSDIYLTPLYMKRYGLRVGDAVLGTIKRREKDGMSAMIKVYAINGIAPEQRRGLRPFETLIPYYPTQRLVMENGDKNYTTRVMDIVTPIGRGQRGLIVAPPRTGKTIMLQTIANSILSNNDDITLIVMLIDERPEEVTDMRDQVKAEIVASTFDEPPEKHKELMELVAERAKRLVENGRHVVILLDSITRLARAYNTLAPKSGRILSGGLDANALYNPKRFFGAARNIQGGGSLTILATALIDTGSRMDELIFEEFKGTGNMELHLDRGLADRRIFPAIDILKSGTRKEELIVEPRTLELMWLLRKVLCKFGDSVEAMEKLLSTLKKDSTNAEFFERMEKTAAVQQGEKAP